MSVCDGERERKKRGYPVRLHEVNWNSRHAFLSDRCNHTKFFCEKKKHISICIWGLYWPAIAIAMGVTFPLYWLALTVASMVKFKHLFFFKLCHTKFRDEIMIYIAGNVQNYVQLVQPIF